jgi:hypothetical protein
MKEKKDEPRKVSTCFEGSPCAEMMKKIMGEEGIGSLCEEMMRSFAKDRRGSGEPAETQKKEGPQKEGPESDRKEI